jgi:hypothetical protein
VLLYLIADYFILPTIAYLGIEKVTEAASPLTLVRLQNDYGWLFESTLTGEVNYLI